MAKSDLHLQAVKLRKTGQSVTSIAARLGVSKGSVSVWCRDIALTKQQREQLRSNSTIAGHVGRVKGAQANKHKKLAAIRREAEHARTDVGGALSPRERRMLVAALYWAEGSKTDSKFIFVNSDAAMARIVSSVLLHDFLVPRDQITLTVQINVSHAKRMKKVTQFWSSLLEIPVTQFTKPYFIHTVSKKKYANPHDYFGVIRIRVQKSSVLQYRMLGYISALKQSICRGSSGG